MHSFFALGLVTRAVRGDRLHARVRADLARRDRRLRLRRPARASTQTTAHGTVPHARVLRVPVHVRGDRAGADLRRVRRAHEVLRVRAVHARLDDARLRSDRALVVGRRRLARRSSARSTTPAARSCTCRRASRRWSCALVLGKRRGYPTTRHPPHDLTMTVLGAGLLWFGWFGFNAGAAPARTARRRSRCVNTHLAAAAGALAWSIVEGSRIKKVTMLGVASGLVAGLVAITPAAGYVSPMVAIVIGVAAGLICYVAVLAKSQARLRRRARCVRRARRRRRDRRAAHRHLRARRAQQRPRRRAVAARQAGDRRSRAAGAWAAVVTFVLLKVLDLTVGLRVDAETEHDGLDGALHGESAYGNAGSVAHQ